jgi:hypothetical protein
MNRTCLIFIHIPKTAGLTLSSVIRGRYDRSRIIRFDTLDRPLSDLEAIPLERRRQADVLMGHIHYGAHQYVPRESTYVTLLRDPVARVVSLYRYIYKEPRHPLHEEMRRSRMGLVEYVESGIDCTQVDNGQTRQIAGVQHENPGEAELIHATANLERMAFVGLTERFDESLLLMSRLFAWRLPLYVSRNVFARDSTVPVEDQPNTVSVSPEAMEVVRSHNHLDLELYDRSARLLAERVEMAGPSFPVAVERFRRVNRVPDFVGSKAWRVIRRLRDASFRRRAVQP